MLDMDKRLRPVRRAAFGVLALSLVLSAPWTGWWTIAPLACAAGFFRAADALTARSERPEYALFAAWTASEMPALFSHNAMARRNQATCS